MTLIAFEAAAQRRVPSSLSSSAVAATTPATPPTDDELLARFAPIFERIAQDAVRREQERELPFEAVRWLKDAGFTALRVPQQWGGSGASLQQVFRLLVRLGEADSNLVQIVRAHFAFVEGRLAADDPAQRERWLPRIVAGQTFGAAMAERTDTSTNSVTLSRRDDHWVLDGRKYYCTGTLYAEWIVAAALDGEQRVAVAVPTDAPGVTRLDDWDGFGQRLTASGTTVFDAVVVPEEHILRRFEPGETRSEAPLTAYYQLFHLAALAGIARAVLRDAVAFVQPRTRAFGIPGQSSPRQDPLVQRVVGRLSSLAFAAESIVERVARTVEAALAAPPGDPLQDQAEIEAYQGQQIAIDLVLQATTLLFEVGGASATAEGRRLDRHWRNARTLASHNPATFRERALGDWHLNGITPAQDWAARWKAASLHGTAE